MSQAQVQQNADVAKEKSQAFAATIYQTSLEVIDASISISYYLAGIAFGLFSGLVGTVQNKQVQADVMESLNGAKQDLLDGAYDIKARVSGASQSAVKDAQPKVDEAKSKAQSKAGQVQGKASNVTNQAQGKASDVTNQAQGKAEDVKNQAQSKASDVKNQAVQQGKQAQGQVKQTAQANGIKA